MRLLPPGTRLLCLICIAVAILFMVTGCGMPAQQSVTTFDAWAAKNVTVLRVTRTDKAIIARLGGNAGGYDPVLNIAAVDVDQFVGYPDQLKVTVAHEEGHAFLLRYGFWTIYPGHTAAIQNEQGAQCIARAATGIVPALQPDYLIAKGYWQCDEPYLSETRGEMRLAGVVP